MKQENPAYMCHEHVRVEVTGALGVVTLNRPEALNALTLDMIRVISAVLRQWSKDASIRAVLFKGAGGRAFCAGGDIKACHSAGMSFRQGRASLKVPTLFFAEEYQLNKLIYNYSKPTISFMNGIVMGGGFGIGGNSRYRVVTDKTSFAMPEVAIGFFPDVGSVYHLMRLKGAMGRYLAFTGNRINAADAFYAGVGGYFVACEKEARLIEALRDGVAICDVLESFSEAPDHPNPMEGQAALIEAIFARDDIFEILSALKEQGGDWANDLHDVLKAQRSPSSILVTMEYFRRARDLSADEILDMDFKLAQAFLQRGDLYEGIYGAVIDKSHKPVWEPAALEDVSARSVNEYFTDALYDLKDMSNF